MNFNKTLIAIALSSTLAACGSDSSTPDPVVTPPLPPAPVETVVDGKGIKGVLTNAVVTVYKFVDGEPVALTEDELVDANIVTDDAGNYSFTVLDYDGPIKVELSPSTDPANPTTMTCDAPAGCGDTAFGQQIDLTAADPEFKLAAISVVDPDSEGDVKVNVSALTHLASELIEASDAGVTAESVSEESSKIASTFGITGDLTQLEPTVTDDAAAVAGEDNEEELRYGLINAGIMAALFSGETDDSAVLSTKLAEVATDLVTNDGALLVNQDEDEDFELALADVLSGAGDAAAAAAEAIKADDTIEGTEDILAELVQEEVNLENEQAYQEANVGEDGLAEVVTEEPTEGDAVTKAKAMVEDMRLFTRLVDEETDEGAGLVTQGDEYAALLDAASLMINTESDSFNLLAQLSEVLADLGMEYDAGTITPEAAAAGINIATLIEGVIGSITFDEETEGGGVLFAVDATSGNEVVALNAAAEFAEDGLSITLDIDGSIESAGASFMINEGSFAKIIFDSAASRTAFEEDTFEGEIVSGELELELELAQKATDVITDPITFTGMLSTKLLPVGERVLDERWDWDDQNQQDIVTYGRPEIETIILPEMLTLSGEFSSLEGNSIGAILTASINNLEAHEAPDFKYIGKEVADILNITFTDDAVVWTESDSIIDEQQYVATYGFDSDESTGNWSGSISVVTEDANKHWAGAGYELENSFHYNGSGEGFTRTFAYVINRDENTFYAKSVRMIPIDQNDDGTIDAYQFESIDTDNNNFTYNMSGMLNSEGEINLRALVNSDGEILTNDAVQSWDDAINLGIYNSLEEFINDKPWDIPYNPESITTVAQYFASTLGNQIPLTVEDEGKTTIYLDEEQVESLAAGEVSTFNPIAYLTMPLIQDVLTVEVSEDGNTLDADFEGAYSATYTFSGGAGSDFNSDEEKTDEQGTSTESIWSEVTDSGLDVPQVIVSRTAQGPWGEFSSKLKFMPIDDQVSGEDGFGVADGIQVFYIGGFRQGYSFNDDGDLLNGAGEMVDFTESSWMITQFSSYDDFDFSSASWGDMGWNPLAFNPLTVANTVDVYQGFISNETGHYSSFSYYLDDVGQVEVDFDEDTLESIAANTTTTFNGYNTIADSTSSLEDSEAFLDINAALTLEAMLGDYEVRLQLSGARTALEQGAFDLDMSYRLPEEESQRSFTVQYNTEEEGRVTANNADGVVLVLEEPAEETEGTQVIGQILVGPTAIVAATIEDRDGIVVIVYSDETTETL